MAYFRLAGIDSSCIIIIIIKPAAPRTFDRVLVDNLWFDKQKADLLQIVPHSYPWPKASG